MAANEALNRLSTTDASNTPVGTDVIGSSLDDELRSIKANIARSARWEQTATQSAAVTLAVTALHKLFPVEGSAGGTTTVTLPQVASAGAGFSVAFKKIDNTNNVIIDGNGSEQIDGAANRTLKTQYEGLVLVCNGTSWDVAADGERLTVPRFTIEGSLTASGVATFKNNVLVEGTLSAAGAAVFNALVTMKAGLDVSATAAVGTLLVGGTSVSATKNKYDATSAPTAGDDTNDGYSVGSMWVDVTADRFYVCVDASAGAAVWASRLELSAENVYTAQQRMTLQTDTSSSNAVTFDFAGGDCFIDLTENITSITISNLPENAWATLIIQQGSGGNAVTGWPAAVKWPAATAPTISTTDNAYDVISFYEKGSDILASVSQDHR